MSRAPRALRRPGRHLGRPGIPASELRSARPARPATPARVGSAATRSGPRPGADDRRRRADREFRLAADHGEGEIDLGRCVCEGPAARLAATGDALPAPPRGHPSYARVDACRVGASPVRTRRAWRSAARSSPTASTAARGGSQRFDAFAPSDESDRCGDAVHPLRLPPPTSEAPHIPTSPAPSTSPAADDQNTDGAVQCMTVEDPAPEAYRRSPTDSAPALPPRRR